MINASYITLEPVLLLWSGTTGHARRPVLQRAAKDDLSLLSFFEVVCTLVSCLSMSWSGTCGEYRTSIKLRLVTGHSTGGKKEIG